MSEAGPRSASSWAASPTGRRCSTPPRRSTGLASPTKRASSRPTARPSGSTNMRARRQGRGLKAIIAGAGGAAHLPGMAAAMTPLPVLGVPVESHALKGSTACCRSCRCRPASRSRTFAIGHAGAINAALFAAAIAGARRYGGRRRPWPTGGARRPTPSPNSRRRDGPLIADAARRARTIGILGGGQLGRMTALAAARLGYRCHIFAAEPDSPGGAGLRRRDGRAHYDDRAAIAPLRRRGRRRDLRVRKRPGGRGAPGRRACKPVLPRPEILEIAQDRLREKDFLRSIGIATARFPRGRRRRRPRRRDARLGRPAVLKTVRLGYDGKGQVLLTRRHRCSTRRGAAWAASAGHPRGLCRFPLRDLGDRRARRRRRDGRSTRRSRTGTSTTSSTRPSRRRGLPRTPRPKPSAIARHIAERLDLVGVLAVEMFVDQRRAACWSTRWRRGRTIPATGRSTPAPPASSSSWCARSAACRSARPSGTRDAVMKNLIGRDVDALARCARRPAGQAAPLRQERGAARPQDGPRHPAVAAVLARV